MSSSQLRTRIAALHADAAAIGQELAASATGFEPAELFEVAGELQGVVNAVEGAQLVAIAHASCLETRLSERGPVDVHHDVGFVDTMASTEVSLATGVGQWAAGRKVGLAANLAGRFPQLLEQVITGQLATVNAAKVVTACDGLDQVACTAVEAVMLDRVVGMDPARITTVARKVATRVAADQVAAAHTRNRKDRLVQVSPGPDGSTDWWARLPAGRSAAAWAAVRDLGDQYATHDPGLTLDQARADALLDLLLTNVTITASVTLGIPVLTEADGQAARDAALAEYAAENPATADQEANHPVTADITTDPADPAWVRPAFATGGLGAGTSFSISAALISGCEIPGIGFIDADTIEALLSIVPTDIGRALLDHHTGTLVETATHAYRPPKAITDFVVTRDGTCRMWGCDRPARRCDIDHARPWPNGPTSPSNLGGLCRRHHRLRQRRTWAYHLDALRTDTQSAA